MTLEISPNYWMTIEKFYALLQSGSPVVTLSLESALILDETREFIDYLCSHGVKAYGLTTGFGSLRDKTIPSKMSADLSKNLILSHDAGIGDSLPQETTLGAMILRALSLGRGNSGFSCQSLTTLIEMINHQIIPEIPCSGSLGASGDLAFLARLGHAMMGGNVPVLYQGALTTAKDALQSAGVKRFEPQSKEGLALINGTSFMTSMLAISYRKEEHLLENLIGSVGLFMHAVQASSTAFAESIHTARNQSGQTLVAQMIRPFLPKTTSRNDLQNDYCIRCFPQIIGPRIEFILDQKIKIERELNAVTDNPLIFKDTQVSKDINPSLLFSFNESTWAVLSGGNFHGENLTASADAIALSNAKIALTLERQITYMLNSWRNKNVLPDYLIPNTDDLGLQSGFMIPHYTANALVHKICLLAQPSSLMNCTSGNESEDVVSYGATACHKLLDQIRLMEQLLSIYFLTALQAYAISKKILGFEHPILDEVLDTFTTQLPLPVGKDEAFQEKYEIASVFLQSGKLRELIGFPFEDISYDSKKIKKNSETNCFC